MFNINWPRVMALVFAFWALVLCVAIALHPKSVEPTPYVVSCVSHDGKIFCYVAPARLLEQESGPLHNREL